MLTAGGGGGGGVRQEVRREGSGGRVSVFSLLTESHGTFSLVTGREIRQRQAEKSHLALRQRFLDIKK